MSAIGTQGEFAADQAWLKLQAFLQAQLPGVDVQVLAQKDFDNTGELVLRPPSVRLFFDGTVAASTSDAQRLSYEAVHRFLVLCMDQNMASPAAQAVASSQLAARALRLLAGTRILLPAGDISEPITWTETAPLPVAGIGVAYALSFEVPGLAQFPGTFAQHQGGI